MVSLEFQAPQIKAAFGQAVAALRGESGLTQEELSSESGIAANSISRTERGQGNLTYFNLKRLAAALQLPASELLARAEEIEAAATSADARLPAADPQARSDGRRKSRKSAKTPAEPRKTVRERRSARKESADAGQEP